MKAFRKMVRNVVEATMVSFAVRGLTKGVCWIYRQLSGSVQWSRNQQTGILGFARGAS